jgi:hypothetical protein
MATLIKWGTTSNLIANGDAEQSTTGWNIDKSSGEGVSWRAVNTPDVGSTANTLKPVSGTCFFTPKTGVTMLEQHTLLSQTVDVDKFSNWIDAGVQTFDFSGYRCSDGENFDYAHFVIKLMDASGGVILAEERPITKTKTWQYDCFSKILPVNTRRIQVSMRAWKGAAHQHYASYFDDLRLFMPMYKIPVAVNAPTVQVGSTVKITPDAEFNFLDITYESFNPNIASVDVSGIVKGLSRGTAQIKIKDPKLPEVDNNMVTITVIGGGNIFTRIIRAIKNMFK